MPIPVSEVESYLRLRHPDFDVDERMGFLETVARLDAQWFETTEDLRPQTKDAGAGGGG